MGAGINSLLLQMYIFPSLTSVKLPIKKNLTLTADFQNVRRHTLLYYMKFSKAIRRLIPAPLTGRGPISFVAAIVITLTSFTLLQSGGDYKNTMNVIVSDVASYYNYLPAALKYQNLKFEELPLRIGFVTTPDGIRVEKMTMGLALLYLPFYLIALLYIKVAGLPYDEYSSPFSYMLGLSGIFYLLAGMLMLRKLLLRYFKDMIAAFGMITVFLGTNLLFYSAYNGPFSHVYNFALIACFAWLSIRWHEEPGWKHTILLGAVTGMITLIRPSNATVILFLLLWNTHDRALLKNKLQLMRNNLLKILALAVIVFIIWLPQMIYWKYATGQFLFFSYGTEKFFFDAPMIHKGLLSYRNGWLVYAPVMVFSLAGMFFLRKAYKQFLLPVTVYFAASAYVIFSWWCWWYVGFGIRSMIDLYPLLAIPLCALLARIIAARKLVGIPLLVLWLLLTAYGAFENWQFRKNMIHFDGMTKKTYWGIFLKTRLPANYYENLKSPDYDLAMQGKR
jgi:hypothetical protein